MLFTAASMLPGCATFTVSGSTTGSAPATVTVAVAE
jgi:hypothetical protein